MYKTYPTFKLFWDAVSKTFKSNNHPTFHPCCNTWTTRPGNKPKVPHASSVKWKQLFNVPEAKQTSEKEYLQAHMIENGWGSPIRVNFPCPSLPDLDKALRNNRNQALFHEHTSVESTTPEAANHPTPHSEPAMVVEPQSPIRFQSQQPQVNQQTQIQPIQIVMNPNRPMPIQPDVLAKIRQINYRTESSLHVGNINSQEIKNMSDFCRSSFKASDEFTQELAARLEATSKELSAVVDRTNLMDRNVHEMRTLVYHLVSQLNAAHFESAAVQTVKKEMLQLEEKQSNLLEAKVSLVVTLDPGGVSSIRSPAAVQPASERVRADGRSERVEEETSAARET